MKATETEQCRSLSDTHWHVQGHVEEELVGQLRERLVQDAEKLRGSALCDVMWSLGILDHLPVDTFKQLSSLLEQQPLRDFQPRVGYRLPIAYFQAAAQPLGRLHDMLSCMPRWPNPKWAE